MFLSFAKPCMDKGYQNIIKTLINTRFMDNIKPLIYFLHSILLCIFANNYGNKTILWGSHRKI